MRAVAAPMPLDPPLTTATFPCKSAMDDFLTREMLVQALPALEVILLQLGRFHRIAREAHGKARLEHEGHGVVELVRLEIGLAGALPGLRVRPVRRHAVVQ